MKIKKKPNDSIERLPDIMLDIITRGNYHQYTAIDNFQAWTLPSGSPVILENSGSCSQAIQTQRELLIDDGLIDKLWIAMYERPVIVCCCYCGSHNAITNSTCIQCGAPLKDYIPIRRHK